MTIKALNITTLLGLALLVWMPVACQPEQPSKTPATTTTAASTTAAVSTTPIPTGSKDVSSQEDAPPDKFLLRSNLLATDGRCFIVPSTGGKVICWACKANDPTRSLFFGDHEQLMLINQQGSCQFDETGKLTGVDLSFRDDRYRDRKQRRLIHSAGKPLSLACGERELELKPLEEDVSLKLITESSRAYPGPRRKLQKLYTRPNNEVVMVQTVMLASKKFKVEVAMGTPPRLAFRKVQNKGGLDARKNLEIWLAGDRRLYFPANSFSFNKPQASDEAEEEVERELRNLSPEERNKPNETVMPDGTVIKHPFGTDVNYPQGGWRASTFQDGPDAPEEMLRNLTEKEYELNGIEFPQLPGVEESICRKIGL